MPRPHDDQDAETRAALRLSRDALIARAGARMHIYPDNTAMISAFADHILRDYRAALDAGRARVAIIVPVGPVGQYQLLVARCREEGIALDRLTVIAMDEYLCDDGSWISEDDPLSFRGHLRRHLLAPLPEAMRPELVIPDPFDPGAVGRRIAALGGLDVAYAGVGITGHLAFNEPMPGVTDAGYFADLPTRVVPLLTETRLINAVTAARGNVARIPRLAVTVGMREILGARRLRIYMNRRWQAAAVRRLVAGPGSAAFPASLAQGHGDWSLHVVGHVLDPAEPELA